MSDAEETTTDAAPAYEIVPIRSWDEFQEVLRRPKYKSWAFRGQADSSWPLPSAAGIQT